jgi:menaquinone-dependent protoporphyrinogen oxidase
MEGSVKILIAYGTTEGHTRKIARFCADTLVGSGHSVELISTLDAVDLDLSRFDGAVLAGSIHVGHFQASLVEFATERHADLAALSTLFLSVSLSAAGNEAEDWAGLEKCIERFVGATGWTPDMVKHVAGAFRFAEYDFFRYWAMRWIAAQKGEVVDPKSDKEYTDWDNLKSAVLDWCDNIRP